MDKCNEMQPTILSDESIIELYWQRDEKAIAETDTKYGKMLFRIAYNILHDSSDCEECKNDTYMGVWNRIPPTKPNSFSAFISKIVRNIAIDRYKERSSKKRVPQEQTVSFEELGEFLHDSDLPAAEYAAKELGAAISEYVKSLSQRQRYIFVGRYYFGESLEFLAGELGISASTVQRETLKLQKGLKAHLSRKGVYV